MKKRILKHFKKCNHYSIFVSLYISYNHLSLHLHSLNLQQIHSPPVLFLLDFKIFNKHSIFSDLSVSNLPPKISLISFYYYIIKPPNHSHGYTAANTTKSLYTKQHHTPLSSTAHHLQRLQPNTTITQRTTSFYRNQPLTTHHHQQACIDHSCCSYAHRRDLLLRRTATASTTIKPHREATYQQPSCHLHVLGWPSHHDLAATHEAITASEAKQLLRSSPEQPSSLAVTTAGAINQNPNLKHSLFWVSRYVTLVSSPPPPFFF